MPRRRRAGLETEIVVAALSGLEHRVLLSVWPGHSRSSLPCLILSLCIWDLFTCQEGETQVLCASPDR